MPELKEYIKVSVVKLLCSQVDYNQWGVNKRAPQIGDTGFVIHILTAPDSPAKYLVEGSEPDGVAIWLAEFLAEELEPLENQH